jgi:2-dehydro-3-deoxyglucarate aldolase
MSRTEPNFKEGCMNRFKQTLSQGQRLIGGWHMSGSAVVAEAMGHVGYDFVVLDMEHGPNPIHGVGDLLRALDAAQCMPVVRMAGHDEVQTKQALDLGARNLYFPMVQDAAQARAIASSCYYPPKGSRGFARMLRASSYTAQADYFSTINDDLMVIAQLETPQALANLEAIAAVEGINGLFVGPGDLAVTMGLSGQVTHPDVLAQLERVGHFCRANQIPLGTVLPNPELANWAFDCGYQFVSMASDLGLMVGAMRSGIQQLKQLSL